MNITVVGIGYVGLSNAILLAQNNEVIALDTDKDKVLKVNQGISPLKDPEIYNYLCNFRLNLTATQDKFEAYRKAEIIIICTPTDYDTESNRFDTSSIEKVLTDVFKICESPKVVIRSTIPIGYVRKIQKRYNTKDIIFAPEFLREGKALYDNLHPSRVIIGSDSKFAISFRDLLLKGAIKKDIPVVITSPEEAECIKLFSNTYLAMRIAFFNELDTFSEANNLSTEEIINGVCLDPRIGKHYNNPSFGYGGYCLPKDTKQLEANYNDLPNDIISSIVRANNTRKDFITRQVLKRNPKCVGVFRLIMKSNSDNFRSSSVQGIIERLIDKNISIIIYEPVLLDQNINDFMGARIEHDLDKFKTESDIIIANRVSDELNDVMKKVYSRDIFFSD